MDPKLLCALSELQAGAGGDRRIQWKVHVQPVRPARRLLRYLPFTYAVHLPQLLSCQCPMAIHGYPTCKGGVISTNIQTLRFAQGDNALSDSQRRCDIHQHKQSPLELYDFEPQRHTFRDEVLQGLQDTRKELPSKYFYDDAGSRLFEQICALDEYYPTRTELSIMRERMAERAELLTHRVWQRQQYEDPHAAGCPARPGWLRAYRHCERAVTALSSSTDPSLSSIGSAARVC